ncbi:calpain-9-like [Petromyzon marinus]|uniref:calpain-9-like n=1 Tax=Petromyzon marinus TaxID=7757 RepID=UPI003F70B8EB
MEEGSAERPERHLEQDFEILRRACLGRGELFEDAAFPLGPQALGSLDADAENIHWLRPQEICPTPRFIAEGATTTDICQGELWDCWLLAALSSLTLYPRLFAHVVPEGQHFGASYCGIFRFRFWQYGRWVEVVVDDRLPTQHGKLVYASSSARHEFWSALLEKAYAKVNGSYAGLRAGKIVEAMEDFTGGLGESHPVSPGDSSRLWSAVRSALAAKALVACFLKSKDPAQVGRVNSEGLVMGHAYAVLGVDSVTVNGSRVRLLRLRNPWGYQEYSGSWNDCSPEWNAVSCEEKERLRLQREDDGEFWMSWCDFVHCFSNVEICSLSPHGGGATGWALATHEGRWVPGCTAGGCRKFEGTFWTNPQFRLTLCEEDDDDSDDDGDGLEDHGDVTCTVVVALMQKNRRVLKRGARSTFLHIGFSIYSVSWALRVRNVHPETWVHYCFTLARSQRAPRKTVALLLHTADSQCAPKNMDSSRGKSSTRFVCGFVMIASERMNNGQLVYDCSRMSRRLQSVPGRLPGTFFAAARRVHESRAFANAREVTARLVLPRGAYVLVPSTYRPGEPGDFFLRTFAKRDNRSWCMEAPDCTFDPTVVFAAPPGRHGEPIEHLFSTFTRNGKTIAAPDFVALFNIKHTGPARLDARSCSALMPDVLAGKDEVDIAETKTFAAQIKKLQDVFVAFDRDGSGAMSSYELGQALENSGKAGEGSAGGAAAPGPTRTAGGTQTPESPDMNKVDGGGGGGAHIAFLTPGPMPTTVAYNTLWATQGQMWSSQGIRLTPVQVLAQTVRDRRCCSQNPVASHHWTF